MGNRHFLDSQETEPLLSSSNFQDLESFTTDSDESLAAPSVPLSENGSVVAAMQPIPLPNNNSRVNYEIIMILGYLIIGATMYMVFSDQFSGTKTKYGLVDALYYITVTLSTVGYGDIVPTTTTTKVLVCIFILVGFASFKAMLDYVIDLHKKSWFPLNYVVDMEKSTTKVGLALGVLIFFIGTGVLVLHFLEKSGWIESTYSSLISITTIGYGDVAFKTIQGRLIASIWIFISTLVGERAFHYLGEVVVNKILRRGTSNTQYVIIKFKEIGNIENNSIHQVCKEFKKLHQTTSGKIIMQLVIDPKLHSKCEYIIFVLQATRMLKHKDIQDICERFDMLDPANSGKITLQLLENRLGLR